MSGCPLVRTRPDGARGRRGRLEAGLEQLHPEHATRDVDRHRSEGVETGRERPHAVERDAAVRCLQPGRAAAGRRHADGTAGVGADRDVGVAVRDRDRRSARRSAGNEARVERIDGRAEPRVGAQRQHRELVQVGLADEPRVRGAEALQAFGVLRGGLRRALDGAATGGRRHALHVDEVLDRDPRPVTLGVERGDEGAHAVKASADCAVSSEPRKNTILPSAKRHQCCMYIDAVLPVALTVKVQWTVAIDVGVVGGERDEIELGDVDVRADVLEEAGHRRLAAVRGRTRERRCRRPRRPSRRRRPARRARRRRRPARKRRTAAGPRRSSGRRW